jgi:type IV fimbrial biogenesis protein FimT
MITVAVAVILLAIAVPSFQNLILSSRLGTVSNALIDRLNSARLNAIKFNAPSQFCGSTSAVNTTDTLGTACATSAGAVYALPTGSAGATKLLAAPSDLTGSIQIASSGVAAVRFSSLGFGYKPTATSASPFGGLLAVICTPRLSSNNRREITMTGGSIITTATTTGACP